MQKQNNSRLEETLNCMEEKVHKQNFTLPDPFRVYQL